MNLALLTDLYELTMLAGYLREGMHEQPAIFDLYFRESPYHGGYAIFAGLQPALESLMALSFSDADLGYLAALGLFDRTFLEFLKNFRFYLTGPKIILKKSRNYLLI